MTEYLAVEKGGQVLKVPKSLEADYVAAGWTVVGGGNVVDELNGSTTGESGE